ncbi:MAG TPA: ATP-dependent helicase, partial [Pedobacter sp.]
MPNDPNLFEATGNTPGTVVLRNFTMTELSAVFILKHSAGPVDTTVTGYFELYPENITIDFASFTDPDSQIRFPQVSLRRDHGSLIFSCRCAADQNKLCEHQVRVFFNLMNRPEIRIFFDEKLRLERIKIFAAAYGLENEERPEDFFRLEYENKRTDIIPVIKDLLPVTREKNAALQELLLPKPMPLFSRHKEEEENSRKILVLKQHRYYSHFQADLLEASLSSTGKIRNPLKQLNATDHLWTTENIDELKFYTAISKFQQNYEAEKPETEINGLKALVKNPLGLDIFYHDAKVSPNITVSSIIPVKLGSQQIDLNLAVDLKNSFYTISGQLVLENKTYDLNLLNIKYKYFVYYNDTMHLIGNADFLKVIDFFRQNNNHLVIHESKFSAFEEDILSKLENRIHITYSYLKPATKEQLKENSFDHAVEKIIYLSDSESFILITPVMRYGHVEVPVMSRKQIRAMDQAG